MKNKILVGSVLIIVSILMVNACVFAQSDNAKGKQVGAQASTQVSAQEHGNIVSNVVKSLLEVVNGEEGVKGIKGGIGEQVKTIAQEQNQSSGTTIQAMERVQTRSRIKTFLFGSDYKNLGTLRSEMVQTENRLEKLSGLIEGIEDGEYKTEIQNQIEILKEEKEKIESFIGSQESKFSLFGWLVKLFNK